MAKPLKKRETARKARRQSKRAKPLQPTNVARQLDCLELRLQGLSFPAIATRLKYADASGAWKAVQSALRETLREPTEELRTVVTERLDRMLLALQPKLKKGDPRAVQAALKIEERRARLLGLDAAIKLEDKHDITFTLAFPKPTDR